MDEKEMITIPLYVFLDGVDAVMTLRAISAMVDKGNAYCCDSIKAMLGIEVDKKTTGTENDNVQ